MANKPVATKKRNPQRPKNSLYKPIKNKKAEAPQPQPTKKSVVKPKVAEKELNDEELKKHLQQLMDNGDDLDSIEFDDESDEDEDGDTILFDDEGEINEVGIAYRPGELDEDDEDFEEEDDEEEEEEEDDEEMESGDEEMEGEEMESGDEEEFDSLEEEEEDPEEEAEDLFNEMKNNLNQKDESDSESEHPSKKLKTQPSQIPTKKLSEKVKFTGNAFQGVASIDDLLKNSSTKPIAKPVKIVNEQEDLENTLAERDIQSKMNLDLSDDEMVETTNNNKGQQKANKYLIYDHEGLNQKLLELDFEKVPWVHSLSVMHKAPMKLQDIHDDFSRESTFYQYSVDSVLQCEKLCKENKLAIRRKPDFFAEMIKSDEHMFKIKAKIQKDKKRVEVADQIRKKREIKKFGKQIQAEKLQERQKQKSEVLDNVKKWRKNREKGNTSDEFSIDLLDEDDSKKKRSRSEMKKGGKDEPQKKSKKRLAKDNKYGFGGKKRYAKTNDAKSTDDFSSFNVARNNEDKYTKGGIKSGKKPKVSRPGKSKRTNGGPAKGKRMNGGGQKRRR